ncbi:cysteine hydrolase [Undibacterium jejuense]|uniref:Cysteine hydrolase n=1 Tax=Undibacterium jejuense TaxID=1344949 RepID=A0A923HDF0_9BURK|nr:cysteine hydrolase family protein [Undibacterium jejuense]MBC3861976.1 cysteine hydrolase [Undibacterium jejuense]
MKSALLIIDVQRGLFDAEPRPFESDLVISRINTLTERARLAATPVVFVQHEAAGTALEFGFESWQLEPSLIVEEGDVILRKTTPDSFLNTNLAELLRQWDTEQVMICGYATEFCVDTTTRRAAALGFPVILVADAHTTHDKGHASAELIRAHHNATLPNIRSFGPAIKAIISEQIVFGLSV